MSINLIYFDYLAGNKYPFTKCISWISSNYIWAATEKVCYNTTLYLTSGENKTSDSLIKSKGEEPHFFFNKHQAIYFYLPVTFIKGFHGEVCYLNFRCESKWAFVFNSVYNRSFRWFIVHHWLWNITMKMKNWATLVQAVALACLTLLLFISAFSSFIWCFLPHHDHFSWWYCDSEVICQSEI